MCTSQKVNTKIKISRSESLEISYFLKSSCIPFMSFFIPPSLPKVVCCYPTLFPRVYLTMSFHFCVFLSPQQPAAAACNLVQGSIEKMPESAWRLFFYATSWSFVAYVVFTAEFDIFGDPPSVFKGWYPGIEVPSLTYWAYAIQCSFYLHCFFATIFLDVWRKDSAMLVMHHVLTLSLIGFSYAARYHNIGILVIFCHDFCDICLEFSKINIYFKIRRDGTYYKSHEMFANFGFVFFSSSW